VVQVRQATEGDIEAIVALQADCFPPPFPAELLFTRAQVGRQMERFAAGQFVAVLGPRVVASASSLVIDEATWQRHGTWVETTGGFYFDNHDPSGTTLYGADISVHPDFRGQGVGRALYEARFDLVRRLKLRRFGTACRLPDWRSWSLDNHGASQEQYVEDVAAGLATDRTLTPLLRYGLTVVGVAHGHMEDDESGNAAAILEWTA
jgi:GNAT superfamily N-acetyltransferase